MKLISIILRELRGIEREKLGAGTSNMYQDVSAGNLDKNQVVKTFKIDTPKHKKMYKIMSEFPKYFAKILRLGDNYVVMERLKPIIGEFHKLVEDVQKIQGKNSQIKIYPNGLFDFDSIDHKYLSFIIRELAIQNKTNEINLLVRLHRLSKAIYEEVEPEFKRQGIHYLDIHGGNIGSDSSGNLKFYDI